MWSPRRRAAALPLTLALVLVPRASAQLWEACNVVHTIPGENSGDNFGWVSRNAGDVDGDGANDIITGAPSFGGGQGRAYLHSGATGALLWSVTGPATSRLGYGVTRLGDITGDGRSDVAVGLPGSAVRPGEVWLLDGPTGAVLRMLSAGQPGDNFGATVERAGDVDGDGSEDVLVGAPGDDQAFTNAGRAYLYSGVGGGLIRDFAGEGPGDGLGSGAGPIADLDGDGHAEVIVGAQAGGPLSRGRAYLLDGAGVLPPVTFDPGPNAVAYGQFFAGACGDVDADGTEDFFVSDWQDTTNGFQSGKVYVYSGATLGLLHELYGEHGGDAYGIGRGWAGDVDHDGHDDLFFASYTDNAGGNGAGTGRVHSGATGELIAEYHGSVQAENLGFDADGLGDVNGDGEPDFVLSSVRGIFVGGTGLLHVVTGSPPPPRAGCDASLHSGGMAARLSYRRSTSLAAGQFFLRVEDAVPNATVIPFYGFGAAQTPLADGTLCVGGPLYRLPLGTLAPNGSHNAFLDYGSAPIAFGPGAVTAGVPVHFQAWFRDAGTAGGANLTRSLIVTFCP